MRRKLVKLQFELVTCFFVILSSIFRSFFTMRISNAASAV